MKKNAIGNPILEHLADALEYRVVIRARRNHALAAFVLVWTALSGIVISLMANYLAAGFSSSAENLLLFAVWVFVFSVPLVILFVIVFWGLFGREKFSVGFTEVVLSKKILAFGFTRRFLPAEVKYLRYAGDPCDEKHPRRRSAWYGMGPGKIMFESGGRTFSFGLALSDSAAQKLVAEIRARLPS